MHDRLIVGFDGSESSATALEWAVDEATLRRASVRVVSSYALAAKHSFGVYTKDETREEMNRQAAACQTQVGAAIALVQQRSPGLGVDQRIVEQPAADALVEESSGADLVVVGAGRPGLVKSFFLGSVTATVLHHGHCPVVVVPAVLHDHTGRVVVGIDGSAHSADAVLWACEQADRLQDELLVIHAWEYPYRVTADAVSRGADIARVDASIVMERALELARERAAGDVKGRIVEASAAEALITASDTADLVVVGSRGVGGFRSMLLGSVAHAVAVHATCPVAVIR